MTAVFIVIAVIVPAIALVAACNTETPEEPPSRRLAIAETDHEHGRQWRLLAWNDSNTVECRRHDGIGCKRPPVDLRQRESELARWNAVEILPPPPPRPVLRRD